MLASVLIGQMRSRLRDEAKEGYSDAELIDSLNFSLSAIAHRLLPWKGRFSVMGTAGVDTYVLPNDFMAPISLVYGGVVVSIQGIGLSLSQDGYGKSAAFIDNNALIISPMPLSAQQIHLNYHALHRISLISDVVDLPNELQDTVLYYALSLALQKEAHEQSMAQSKYYHDLYEQRCRDISKVSAMRRSSISVKSHFQKV